MARLALLLLGLTFAIAAPLARPAAPPKPTKSSRPWFDGWDKPIDPVGDCTFERKGERLTIKVPGPDHGLEFWDDSHKAPRLMRDVAGDFAIQVRVGGSFRPARGSRGASQGAGLVMLSGQRVAMLLRTTQMSNGKTWHSLLGTFRQPSGLQLGHDLMDSVTPPSQYSYLRMERHGHTIELKISPDGKRWTTKQRSHWDFFLFLPKKVKVGVVATSQAKGTVQAEFDQFQLTPLGRPSDGKKP